MSSLLLKQASHDALHVFSEKGSPRPAFAVLLLTFEEVPSVFQQNYSGFFHHSTCLDMKKFSFLAKIETLCPSQVLPEALSFTEVISFKNKKISSQVLNFFLKKG